jgi:predicted RNA binding protein YcfA (HicA-like mRNA interferase family)
LLDGDGGRQAFDHVHIGLVHQLQELARISRQAFHISALALGVQRVKRQTGFARARQAGNHHQLVARDVEVDVFQVVRARTADADGLLLQGTRQVSAVCVMGHRSAIGS